MRFEREISRTVSFKSSQGPTVRGTLHKLSRRQIVFEIYDPFLLVRTSEVLSDLQVRRGREYLYRGDAIVTSVISTSILLVISATLIGNWSELGSESIQPSEIRAEVRDFIGDWERANRLRDDYRLRVVELRTFMADLRYWLDQVDVAAAGPGEESSPIGDEQFEELKFAVMPKLGKLSMGLEESSRQLTAEEIDNHKQFAQRDLLPLTMPSPFFHRVFTKPLGYVGDYGMVNMMYQNQRGGRTTYAQIVDYWLLQLGPAEAHRNRIVMLEQTLTELVEAARQKSKPLRILNIGCGPVQELQLFFSRNKSVPPMSIDLLDFNSETLDYAKSQLTKFVSDVNEPPTITYTLKSVQDLLKQAIEKTDAVERYDFVYCAGLFDYLSDRVSSKLVRLFYHWCVPGGTVLVTNVHASNPVKGLMEHAMEWHLVLRSDADMLSLVPNMAKSKIYSDTTGINVFLEIYKSS